MKKLTSLFVVLCMSFATMAGHGWAYNRLDKLYNSDQSKCLKISKRYIKLFKDTPASYYFASIVYRNKSKKHGELKTRYMMMSKSIGYAMKFEDFEEIDLEKTVNWEGYLDELQSDTYLLYKEMESTELANFGERLAMKHQKMVEQREDAILIADGESLDGPPIMENTFGDNTSAQTETASTDASETTEPEAAETVVYSTDQGYFGLATGNETAPMYNGIQEQLLLDLINEQRKELFMTPLKLDEGLILAARYHAYDMAMQNYFMPDSYDATSGGLVYVASKEERIGQFHPIKHVLGQNIAAGPQNAMETLEEWMLYDAEYDVLFDESSKKVGIGLYHHPESNLGTYWVLVTAKK